MTQEPGFLVIDKPSGITSHDVVANVRRRFKIKQVGHAGTLDPMATGVLVIGIGIATKFLQHIVAGKKKYLATIRLGVTTTTDDCEGAVLEERDCSSIQDLEVSQALANFVGQIEQVPSSVSAIKVQGRRAYDLVREGKAVELKARTVEIQKLQVLGIRRTDGLEVDIEVTCSAGTYIRAIARDLGRALGVGGHLTSLRRTLVAPFTLESAASVESAELIPLSQVVREILPTRVISEAENRELGFGRRISRSDFEGVGVALDHSGSVVAILENQDGRAQPINVFMKES